jgi:hypothetical protein
VKFHILPLLAGWAALTLLVVEISSEVSRAGNASTPQAVAEPNDEAIIAEQKWSYPLKTCAVCNVELGKPVTFVVEKKMIRTCSDTCKGLVQKEPRKTIVLVDKAVVDAQKANYPLQACPVTGDKLGERAVDKVLGMRLVRFATEDAAKSAELDPKPVMAKVDDAYIKAQRATYPSRVCVVCTQELGSRGEPVDRLLGTTLYRFCSGDCARTFESAPPTPPVPTPPPKPTPEPPKGPGAAR